METLLYFIETYGLWVVFICVLLDQSGLPFPAYPLIVVMASVATNADKPWLPVLAVATTAALLADFFWYSAGTRFGSTLLRLMCRLSLSPDSCVGLTRRVYERWGAPSLIVSKFVPGFVAIATALAGATGTPLRRFAFYDAIGAVLWAGTAVALGVAFHSAVGAVLLELEALGRYALVLLAAALTLFVVLKWWQRYRFTMQIRMSRISIPELAKLMEQGTGTTILDVRTPELRARQGWIPGAIPVHDIAMLALDPQSEIVIYCDCPNEASAAVVARKLKDRGFNRVRPLIGGLEAWAAQGRPISR